MTGCCCCCCCRRRRRRRCRRRCCRGWGGGGGPEAASANQPRTVSTRRGTRGRSLLLDLLRICCPAGIPGPAPSRRGHSCLVNPNGEAWRSELLFWGAEGEQGRQGLTRTGETGRTPLDRGNHYRSRSTATKRQELATLPLTAASPARAGQGGHPCGRQSMAKGLLITELSRST